MKDFKSNAILRNLSASGGLGSPVSIALSKGLGDVPCPTRSLCPTRKDSKTSTSIRGTGLLGIARHGTDHYIIITWNWCDNKEHTHLVDADRVDWLAPVNIGAMWRGSRFKIVNVTVNKKVFQAVGHTYGLPDDADALWAYAAFLPKRRPAAVRVVTPCYIQIWIGL